MENGVVNGGKKEKSQGPEGSTSANDMWVWMRPHIGFCTIGKCGLLSFFQQNLSQHPVDLILFFFSF
jgi:hypothetical protein